MAEQRAIGCKENMSSNKERDNLGKIAFNKMSIYISKIDMKFIEEIRKSGEALAP